MKLLSSLLIHQSVTNAASCNGSNPNQVCVTECEHLEVGSKWRARQKWYFQGDDSVTSRFTASPANSVDDHLKDYRFSAMLPRNQCGKKLLDAFLDGTLSIDISDYAQHYTVEGAYFESKGSICKEWQQGLFAQFRHSPGEEGERNWTLGKNNNHKDIFYLSVYGLRNLSPEIATREKVMTCVEKAFVERIEEVGAAENDYTKCLAWTKCKKTPDWDPYSTTSTTTTTTTVPTTTTEAIMTTQSIELPDYNNDDYTYACDDSTKNENEVECTITMSDGQKFTGKKVGSMLNFKNIPYAEPPVGSLRWKSPRLITHYADPIDAREFGPSCATMQTQDNNPNQDQSEDCLGLNISVPEWAIINKKKLPMVAFIHGGGFGFGTNRENMSPLASQGLVGVNIAYRLGPYGFLCLDSVEEGETYKCNWGLQDQLAGLKWISMFAGVFGGNKDSVCLDGCSAGSQAGWHHITSEDSWPYFTHAVTNGVGLPAGIYYEESGKPAQIRETVFTEAGVSSIDELRQLSTGTLRTSWVNTINTLQPSINSSPQLDPMYGPVIDGAMIKDHLAYLVRNGNIRPNTPIAQNYAKDDAWGFNGGSFETLAEKLLPANVAAQISQEQEDYNINAPAPWQDQFLEILYPSHADEMKAMFGCPAGAQTGDNCEETFGRFIQASIWYCNTRWAYSGVLKTNPEDYGAIYPMQWGYPNCDKDENNQNTKTCHCSETAWVHGSRAWNGNDLGQNMKDAYGNFFKTGTFTEEANIKSWEEMNFNAFNVINATFWGQEAIKDWAECETLDLLQASQQAYTWGHTKNRPNGL